MQKRILAVWLIGAGTLLGALAFPGPMAGGAHAQDYFTVGQSLASNLLVNRTQIRILRRDDKIDRNCRDRQFVRAQIIKQPEVRINGNSVPERKWQEYWSLDRCGAKIGYYVFFTEVGEGGAYFSILGTE